MEEVSNIDFKTLLKTHLVVGEILVCEPVEGSSKLLRMDVDLGSYGKRQILAGVAKKYKPEELIGKKGMYVANLAPRSLMGLESQGMMLFGKDEQGNMAMATISDSSLENGARVL